MKKITLSWYLLKKEHKFFCQQTLFFDIDRNHIFILQWTLFPQCFLRSLFSATLVAPDVGFAVELILMDQCLVLWSYSNAVLSKHWRKYGRHHCVYMISSSNEFTESRLIIEFISLLVYFRLIFSRFQIIYTN